MSEQVGSSRDRLRQRRELAKAAGDKPMRSMLERIARELDEEARKIEADDDDC